MTFGAEDILGPYGALVLCILAITHLWREKIASDGKSAKKDEALDLANKAMVEVRIENERQRGKVEHLTWQVEDLKRQLIEATKRRRAS